MAMLNYQRVPQTKSPRPRAPILALIEDGDHQLNRRLLRSKIDHPWKGETRA